jgi:putative tryptophan/tyrosine transport system substrate-binding protein
MQFDQLRRRYFITLLGGAVVAWPLAARAQQSAMPVVGFLNNTTPETSQPFVTAFRRGLGQAGYIEGRNVEIDYRWGRNQSDRLPDLVRGLVQRPVAVIVASGGDQAMRAAQAATSTIPIVATIGNDPVETGLVRSLNRPEGNLTGVSVFAVALVAKRLELARELAPNAPAIAFLADPNNPNSKLDTREIEDAAQTLDQKVVILSAGTEDECDAAFAGLAQHRAGALIVESDPFFNGIVVRLVILAARHAIPVVFPRREFADAGGLLSYGTSLTEAYRQIGIYTGRVLKGTKPAELPILLPSRYELVLNLKTAKALGITTPTSILLRADEVIE